MHPNPFDLVGHQPLYWLRLLGFRYALYWTAVLLTPFLSQGDLVLSNFSSSNPMKVMAIGDSITDDCVYNGAWRQYLQPLLDANGYPFVFVGRQASSPSGGFTKVFHEGYCGAVIAPPGVLTYAVHGYAGPDVYLQKIVADALTNATPDLVLLLIGVNDIGRGRDPMQVATNDMPNLLNLIFSNAPNANVVLAKVTSLVNANLSGLNYAAYATNIYTYNAALQTMVDQRRALGQNVFLADMFSVVDPNTMYNADHVHPNALGLQAMAQEWFTRIQAITVTSNLVVNTLVHGGETWRYSDNGQDLGTNWDQPGYDDIAWSSGPARLGYGGQGVATTVSYGASTTNRNITTYFRHWFSAPDGVQFTNLNFRLLRVDGAVVWLNGKEAFRTNMPNGPIAYTNVALRPLGFDAAYTFYATNIAASNLRRGTNLLAVEVHLLNGLRSMLSLDLELLGTGFYVPPLLSIALSNGTVWLSWPTNNSAGYTLYSSTNLPAPGSWVATSSAVTNGDQLVVTQPLDNTSSKFFRLRKP
jgi:lysophospholipase L1-like esterase